MYVIDLASEATEKRLDTKGFLKTDVADSTNFVFNLIPNKFTVDNTIFFLGAKPVVQFEIAGIRGIFFIEVLLSIKLVVNFFNASNWS